MMALAVSLLAHVLIVREWPAAGRVQHTAVAPQLQVRLELRNGVEVGVVPAVLVMADARPVLQSTVIRPKRQVIAPQPGALRSGSESSAGADRPDPPDPRYYLARELDHYPAPLLPLSLPNDVFGSIRLWVSVDHAGQVVDAAVIDADPPGLLERPVRDLVLSTRFMPARKNGHPVKSRVLLVLRQ